jgi:D-aminoacyl-tRNA deacylase
MRAVVQRVREAEVLVDGGSVGRIGPGLLVFAGIARGDGPDETAWMARKIASLRVFDDEATRSQLSVVEAHAEILAISQFTLLADCRKGRRPSYDDAMSAEVARGIFDGFVAELRIMLGTVATGRFGADMHVRLVNDGPFTLVIDSMRERDTTASKV